MGLKQPLHLVVWRCEDKELPHYQSEVLGTVTRIQAMMGDDLISCTRIRRPADSVKIRTPVLSAGCVRWGA